MIFAISILLWALAHYPQPAAAHQVTGEQQLAQSALGRIGHAIEPAVRPLGYDWKIAVSMVASFAAREVFVSTMGMIYSTGTGTVQRRSRNACASSAIRAAARRCTRPSSRWG